MGDNSNSLWYMDY